MRKKRKAPTFAQNISCAFCGKTAKKKHAQQRYCSDECRISFWGTKTVEKTCEVCNTTYFSKRPNAQRACGKFCGDVLNSVEQQTFSDEEIIHLALLNAGYGITRFEEKVPGLSYTRGGGRLLWIRNEYLEETGIDIYQVLGDSTKLIEMKRDEWMANGRPPRVANSGQYGHTGARIKSSEIMERLELAKANGGKEDRQRRRSHMKVRVYPEFNWGPYKGRQ